MTNDNTAHDANYDLIAVKYDTISVTDMQFINKRVHVSLFFYNLSTISNNTFL